MCQLMDIMFDNKKKKERILSRMVFSSNSSGNNGVDCNYANIGMNEFFEHGKHLNRGTEICSDKRTMNFRKEIQFKLADQNKLG